MDEKELQKIFSNNSKFSGVFAADEIFSIVLEKDTGIIVNTSVRELPYGHWIGVYKDRCGGVFFFDSLCIKNLLCEPYFLYFFKNNHVNYVKTLCHSIQPINSQTCGLYCIYFLKEMFKFKNFNCIFSVFNSTNLFANDFFVVSYVNSLIK